ncbi:MAG: glycosyltransferase [Chloroflexi bacterium]|nr:glycosyltransferase [Chloroflexota bacterium]
MHSKPLVSIIIPTYNRVRFLPDAIDSCLSQTYDNLEIIVIDDGSSDGTSDYVRQRYGDAIRLFVQRNQGPGIARNRGIAEARGEFIHFLDADDQLHSRKIESGLGVFQRQTDVSVLYTHFQFVAGDGVTKLETPPFEQFSDDVFCELLRQTGCHILISSSMYRAAALREVGGFADDPEFRSAEDWDLFLRLAAKFKFHAIDQRLVYRRMHADMMSSDRLYGALGRLKTVQNARRYGWQRCMGAEEFDRKEASRHHVYALYLWTDGDRAAARKHFLRAAALYRPESRQRRLYALYTWLLPPASVDWTVRLARLLRALR